MNNKITFGILIIVTIIFGIGIWWYFTNLSVPNSSVSSIQNQTQTSQAQSQNNTIQTAGWQTYTNSLLGISIQYPTDWQTYKLLSQVGNLVESFAFCQTKNSRCMGGYSGDDIELYAYKIYEGKSEMDTATSFYYLGFNPKSRLYFYLLALPNQNKIFDQMVGTFKFTK